MGTANRFGDKYSAGLGAEPPCLGARVFGLTQAQLRYPQGDAAAESSLSTQPRLAVTTFDR